MKHQELTTDMRLRSQLFTIACLACIPFIMIALNGGRAIRALLNGPVHAEAPAPPVKTTRQTSLQFGVYDPKGVFAADKQLKIRHLYISWIDFDADAFKSAVDHLQQNEMDLLLTIEPWADADRRDTLLVDVASGHYDDRLKAISAQLVGFTNRMHVVWGHEMDQDLTERYPWSGKAPDQFIAAYRHVTQYLRKQFGEQVDFVWSGVIKDGSLRYWPGDQYVHYVGMPIYSFPSFDQRYHGYIRDFRTTFSEKAKQVRQLNKPLMITELGVAGSDDFKSFWMHQAFLALDDYPEIATIVFFYGQESEGAWGKEIETPDWLVHPDTIRGLVKWTSK